MKKLILSILALSLFSIGAYTQCFTPVWTEPSHDSMLIYVSLATLYGTNLQVGDEIGVFEREECVGVGVLTEELTGTPVYLVIETSRERPGQPGFRPGRTITYRFCSGGEVANPLVTATYISNGPTFEANDSCVVELRAVNTAPIVTSIPDTVALEDELYSSSITAIDFDGDSLIYRAPLLPAWLSFNDTTQMLSGTPGNSEVGFHELTLSIYDGVETVDTTFTIRVANTNDAPVYLSLPDTMAMEDLPYFSAVDAEDMDGDSLIYRARRLPSWLSFNDTTHVLSGTPVNEDVGDHRVTLRVDDGTVRVDTSFIIHVRNTNDAPSFLSLPDTMALEDTPYYSEVMALDMDGDSLIFTSPVLPAWLSFNDTTHILSGTPVNDDVGDHPVTLRIYDGTVQVDTTFVIHVENTNDAPTFTSIPDTLAWEDELYSDIATAEDMDGDAFTISARRIPDWLSFNETTNTLSGTPTQDDLGEHRVTLRVTDGMVRVDSSFMITVLNTNDAPSFTSTPTITGLQGSLYSYTTMAEDIDGDTLSFSAPVLPTWLSFDTESHILSGIPGNNHVGDNHVVLMCEDHSVSVFQSFTIVIENVNDPPTFTSIPITETRPGSTYEYTLTAEDIDGDELTFTALVLPGWLTFNTATHTLSATPGEEDVGAQHVTVRVSDGTLYEDQIFILTVDYGNHAPTFTSDPATSVALGDPYIYTIAAQDMDGDDLSYSAPVLPDWLSYYPATNVISGIPHTGDLGSHHVTVRVSDGTVSADQSFRIRVESVNNAPTFTSTPETTVTEERLYVYYAAAEDIDEDDLSFLAPQLPHWLSFDVLTQILHGTPGNEEVGDHLVTLRVSDGDIFTDQTFTITVEVQSVVGIVDFRSPDFMKIYPNPSDGRIIIEMASELEEELKLEIIDPLGKILIQKQFPPYHLIREEYNLCDQPAGIYFTRVTTGSDQITKKLMIK